MDRAKTDKELYNFNVGHFLITDIICRKLNSSAVLVKETQRDTGPVTWKEKIMARKIVH